MSWFVEAAEHRPLHHCQGVTEPRSKNLPDEILSQSSDSLQEGAEVPERTVKPTAVIFRSDIQPPTWETKTINISKFIFNPLVLPKRILK